MDIYLNRNKELADWVEEPQTLPEDNVKLLALQLAGNASKELRFSALKKLTRSLRHIQTMGPSSFQQ